MEGYDPMGTQYLSNPLTMSQGASTEEYMNIMAPIGLPDQTTAYPTNAYQR